MKVIHIHYMKFGKSKKYRKEKGNPIIKSTEQITLIKFRMYFIPEFLLNIPYLYNWICIFI